jgi:hypothetical protein
VVLWSDGNTRALGQVSARGGLVETSGKYLDVNGIGVQAGTWLLDPYDIEIVATGGSSNLEDSDQFQDSPTYSSINAGTLSSVAPGTNIVLQAMHDVKFWSAINPALGSGSLTVEAGNSIFINAAIQTGGGALGLNADHPAYATKTGKVVIGAGGSIDTGGGSVTMFGSQVALGGPLVTQGGNVTINGGALVHVEQNIATGNGHLTVTANDISFGGTGTTASGGFMLFNNMGGTFTLGPNWTLASSSMIDIHADTMSLLGTVGPSQTTRPFVGLTPYAPGRPIDIGGTSTTALGLDPAALARFDAEDIHIGNPGYTGNISVLSEYSGGKTSRLGLQTQGNILVKAPVILPSAIRSGLMLMVDGNNHMSNITTGAGGKLAADHIELRANNMSIGAPIEANGVFLMPHMATGQIALGAGAADGFDMLGLLDTELMLIRAGHLAIGGNPGQMGGLTVTAGGMDFSTVLPTDSELRLLGGFGNVTLNGNLVAPGFLFMEGNHLQSAKDARAKAMGIRLQSHFGIGGDSTPFLTQTGFFSASNDSPDGLAPINIANTGELVVADVHQNGAGNQGSIAIANSGGMTVAGGGPKPADDPMSSGSPDPTRPPATGAVSSIFTGGSGSIKLKTMSPLTIHGDISTQSGAIMLEAGNGGQLSIGPDAHLSSVAGNIGLVAGAIVNAGNVTTASGNINISAPSVNGEGIFSAPGGTITGLPAKVPTVAECLGNAAIPGCTAILKVALDACVAAPAGPNCLALLPSLAVCTGAPTTYGCSVVLPTLTQCVGNPALQGCTAVLPTLSQCTAAPATNGCKVVLPTLAQCVDSPTLQGCTAVLPTLSECAGAPSAPGCSVVLLPVTPVADSKLEEAIKVTVDALAQSHEDVVLGAGDEDEKKDDSVTAVVAAVQGEKSHETPKTFCN